MHGMNDGKKKSKVKRVEKERGLKSEKRTTVTLEREGARGLDIYHQQKTI